MRCFNCGRKLPKNAKACSYCEAPVEPAPSAEELDAARDILENLPPEIANDLQQAVANSATADDFINSIFVGECPKCSSANTGNCENDPDIDNLLVGRCYDCGQLFCTECLQLLKPGATECACLDEEDFPD